MLVLVLLVSVWADCPEEPVGEYEDWDWVLVVADVESLVQRVPLVDPALLEMVNGWVLLLLVSSLSATLQTVSPELPELEYEPSLV